MDRLVPSLALIALAFTMGCGRSLPPPSGSSDDASYKKQRLARQDYSETAIIQACPETATRCTPAAAILEHHFEADGQEQVFVQRIELQGGEYVNLGEARVPGRANDGRGQAWDLKW